MMKTVRNAAYWKEKLQLTSHPEGGAFGEVYRAGLVLPQHTLTPQHNGDRNAMTSIYFLLSSGEYSAFHRIASDELWHHYDGDTLCVYEITIDGALHTHMLGITNGALPFAVIRAGSWFASRVAPGASYALVGCTVAPGFDFADFELADRSTLQRQYPQHTDLIAGLCVN